MNDILKQLKKRRLELGFKQKDMMLRIGLSRQQYQHLESKGNPRLDTLELIARGLNSELMLIPKEKVTAVNAVVEKTKNEQDKNLLKDPWQDLLGRE
jgi:transcriptional regulator with XRE-family HTH domain